MIDVRSRLKKLKFYKPRYLVKFIVGLLKAVFILGICFTILYPLIQKFSMSLMDQRDLFDRMVKFIPNNFRLSNYPELIGYIDYWKALGNTVKVSTIVAVLQTFSTVAVGYGFAKFNFKGRGFLFACVIVAMIIPPMIIITPLYLNFRSFDLFGLLPSGSFIGNIVPFVVLSLTGVAPRCALYIFLARQFFRGIPKEIEEAAAIDGAGIFRVYWSIMLRSARSVMVTIFLFSFVWQYNDIMLTGMMYSGLNSVSKRLYLLGYTFSAAISMDASGTAGNIGYISIMQATGTLMVVMPLIIMYIFLQKQFTQSVERTGLVG
jgi:multiple sugar transport system permease protein